jgi:diguanylate cyclase (GGDEF)-like protein/PAS domain S-box-containing protein
MAQVADLNDPNAEGGGGVGAVRRVALVCYGAWMAFLAVAIYALPRWHIVLWSAIGLSSAAAVGVGVVIHRPRRRGPWLLVAAALVTFSAGDTTYDVLTGVMGQENPFPSAADVLYLAMYPLLAAGLLGFVRCRTARRDRASLLDALILTAGLTLLSWVFLIVPYVVDAELTVLEKATSIAYPLGDVLILAILARLLAGAGARARAVGLLGVGGAGLLVADVLYGLIQLNGSWSTGSAVDLGWIAFYAACGGAALHPSMTLLTQPIAGIPGEGGSRRLALLALVSLIAPAVLLKEAATGTVDDGAIIAVLSAVMFLLVLSRLGGVVARHREALARERGLREASAALVSAADVEDVAAAVRTAVTQLLPADTYHRVIVVVSDAEGLRPVAPDHGWRLRGPAASWPAWAEALETRTVRLRATRELGPALGEDLAGLAATLLCPLVLDDRPAGDPLVGFVVVGADEPTLVALQDPLQVLASQAALAFERVALNGEVNRRNSEIYFRTLVQNASDVIVIVDDDDRVRYASPSAETVFELDRLADTAVGDLVHPHDRDRVEATLRQIRAGLAPDHHDDWRILRFDGSCIEVDVTYRNLRADETVRGLVLTLRDVTERRQLERELTHRAFHDSLTGLANRVLFQDRVEHAVARGRRDGKVVGVLFLDLDDFKVVNDTMGHGSGDELLGAVARRLTDVLRPHDTAARLGGDEFAALIEDAASPTEVEEIAERIVLALLAPFTLDSGSVSGGASIGLATTAEATSAEELLRHADLALYAAKTAGKGQWRRYRAVLHTAMLERLELRAALEQAVADGAFTLRYQPIVRLDTDELVGFEALVRWRHPKQGLIPPNQFIGVAEESGVIVPLGNWVLQQALTEVADWQVRPGQPQPYVSVNVSARQFRAHGFVEGVRNALAASGIAPGSLMLEITESLLIRDDQQVAAGLVALHELGVQIAIDDFGTGYSSLSYLQQFPIDVLKIDKSFIDHITASPKQTVLVEAIIRLAGTLDLRVIAEGIEDPAQRDLLARMHCPLGQGYLFARPLSAAEAARRLLAGPYLAAVPAPVLAPVPTTLACLVNAGTLPDHAELSGEEAHG